MTEKIFLKENHPFLSSSIDITEICKPFLLQFGISNFLYTKLFRNGSCIWLTNRADWLSHYCRMEYYQISTFEQNINQYQSGTYLWYGIHNKVLEDALKNFNIANGITIIEKSSNYCEFYHFSTNPSNLTIVSFYINNHDILRRFIFYFKDKAHKLLTNIEVKSKIILPMPATINNLTPFNNSKDSQDQANKNFINIPCNKYYLGENYRFAVLTKREVECIEWLSKGKSAEEIGMILNISRRTVINHIENIKSKTGCCKTTQIVKIAYSLGMIKL